LAWAITVHKSQGMSLDAAEMNLSKCFEPGMGYVALSRVRSLDGVKLTGLNKTALEVNDDTLEVDRQLKLKSDQLAQKFEEIPTKEKKGRRKEFLDSIGAKSKKGNNGDKAYSVEKIRKTHPRAYKKWTAQEEQQLIKLYNTDKTYKQIAKKLQRQKGAISSRVKKLREQDRLN